MVYSHHWLCCGEVGWPRSCVGLTYRLQCEPDHTGQCEERHVRRESGRNPLHRWDCGDYWAQRLWWRLFLCVLPVGECGHYLLYLWGICCIEERWECGDLGQQRLRRRFQRCRSVLLCAGHRLHKKRFCSIEERWQCCLLALGS